MGGSNKNSAGLARTQQRSPRDNHSHHRRPKCLAQQSPTTLTSLHTPPSNRSGTNSNSNRVASLPAWIYCSRMGTQANYLQFKKSRLTSKRWISALIKKLWEIIWSIWRYRNSLVHDQTNLPINKITTLLNITMLRELQYGLAGLPRNFSYLFQKKMTSVLKISINKKKQWILTVWTARDAITPTHISTTHRHPIIASILVSWKKRIIQYEENQSSIS